VDDSLIDQGLLLLEDSGVPATVSSDAVIELRVDGSVVRARPLPLSPPPTPSRIDKDLAALAGDDRRDVLMYFVEHATTSLLARARSTPEVCVVALRERLVLIRGRKTIVMPIDSTAPAFPVTRGRVPWGRLAVARCLVRTPASRTQSELAAEAGVSQVAVHHALRELRVAWSDRDPHALWSYAINRYPGPGGSRRSWVGIGTMGDQVEKALEAGAMTRTLVSGDAAADEVAPWRRGRLAVVYADRDLDLSGRFALAGPDDQPTLQVVVPRDPTIFATADAWASGEARHTDPLITAWEVMRSPGPDAEEAADHLRSVALKGWARE
jgi:hypothetical protein